MTQLLAIVEGEEFDLSDKVKMIHLGQSGFGLPNLQRLTDTGPNMVGLADLGYKINERTIQLALMTLSDNTVSDYFARREELAYIFSPRDRPIVLRWKYQRNNEDVTRDIYAFYTGGLELDSSDKSAFISHKVAVNLICPDPLWFNPEASAYVFSLGISGNQMTIPLNVAWNVGASTLNATAVIQYAGTFRANPIINITGPITDLKIVNSTTGKKIQFSGTIPSGQTWVVDTRQDRQTVLYGTTNKISTLTDDSDLSFAIEPKPTVANGENVITVTGTSGTSATQISLQYNEKFIGL